MVTVKGYHRAGYTVKGHDVKGYTRKAAAKKSTTKKGKPRRSGVKTTVKERQKKLARRVDPKYPYFRDTDWICDGIHKDGMTRPPKRMMCLSSGDVVLNGWCGTYCRLRHPPKDTRCIWWSD